MKTTRTNCFETNSSSTHSFTIISKSELKEKKSAEPLFDDNTQTLHVDRLSQQDCVIVMSGYGEDNWQLNAATVHEKAALFVHHVDGRYEKKLDIELVKRLLQEMCGYSAIVGETRNGYDSYNDNDYGNSYIDRIQNSDDIEEAVREFIRDVILNPDTVMQESENAY